MTCPNCQHENRSSARFCSRCRTPLQRLCPECGAEVVPDDRFCDACGAELPAVTPAAVAPAPFPRLEELQERLYIPRPLAERMQAAEQEMAGENRLVTALFADISNFTVLSQQHPAERVVEIVNDCFRSIVDAVLTYEGSINQFLGDCVLAFFGAPILHENDPERAILSALAIQREAQRLALSLSVGINTGMVYFGPVGTAKHREISAYGPEINRAKRLQEAARPGQILVGESTYRVTRRAFDFGRVEGLALKGIGERETAYEALRAKERPEKVRGIEGLRARMIGREREFAEVKEACAQWLAGRGQIVSIIGEAGIGKSRLVSELKQVALTAKNVLFLEGRCVSIGQPVSYWPFLDLLRSYFHLAEEDRPQEIARKVTEGVIQLFPHTGEEFLPFLGRLLSISFGNEWDRKLETLAPEQVRHQTLMRLRDLLETLARQQPLLLILEDLHWADDLSLDLIALLMDALVTTPLILVCVYRPEREHRVWQLGTLAQRKCLDRYTEIPLRALSASESRQLVENLLTIDDLPESVKALILRKSEGNPFFIEEVIRSLIDRELVYQEGGRWRARAEVTELDVPDTIQSVVLARVDRLEAEAKAVLQCASVIGRLFRYRLLEEIARHDRELDVYLGDFAERDLIYEERRVPEREYAFWHALTQEATYGSILERRRREYHQRIGEGIEHLYRERLEEYYEELAYHYSRSEATKKAVEYLLKAGEKAKRRSANEAAIAHFRKALELLEQQPASRERDERELEAQIGLGPALMATRGYGAREVEQSYARAWELCRQIGDSEAKGAQHFAVLWGVMQVAMVRAELREAQEMAEELLQLAQRRQERDLLLAAHEACGAGHFWRGEFAQAREHLESALALYDPARHHAVTFIYGTDLAVFSRSFMALLLWMQGYPDQSLTWSIEAERLARELSNTHNLSAALNFASWLRILHRDTDAARAYAEAEVAFAAEKGAVYWVAIGTLHQGWVLWMQGQTEEGITRIREGVRDYFATGSRLAAPATSAGMAEAYAHSSRAEEGLALVDEALAVVESTEERVYEAEIHRVRGELLRAVSPPNDAEAEDCFRRAIEIARRQGAKSWELRAAMSLARLWQQQGKRAEARELLAEIYDWFTEGFGTADLREAKALLDSLTEGPVARKEPG